MKIEKIRNGVFEKHPFAKYAVLALVIMIAAVMVVQISEGSNESSAASYSISLDSPGTIGVDTVAWTMTNNI